MKYYSLSLSVFLLLQIILTLGGCQSCSMTESNNQVIDSDGTRVFIGVTHCSALNNSISFYIEQPAAKSVVLADAADIDEYGMDYDKQNRTIMLISSSTNDINLHVRQIGPYHIKKISLLDWQRTTDVED